ncbi:hypothetical protein B0H14DRAFT_2807395, partial [Mycena olivaceomarginata]
MVQVPTLRDVPFIPGMQDTLMTFLDQLTHLTLQCQREHSRGILIANVVVLLGRWILERSSLGHLLEHLSMPHLRQFHAEGTVIPGGISLATLTPSSPLIEDLGNLHLPSLTAESVAETFHSLSSLTRLCVTDYNVWAANRRPHVVVCPALRELVINYCGDLEQGTLDAFIQGRKESFRNPSADILSEDQMRSYISQG